MGSKISIPHRTDAPLIDPTTGQYPPALTSVVDLVASMEIRARVVEQRQQEMASQVVDGNCNEK